MRWPIISECSLESLTRRSLSRFAGLEEPDGVGITHLQYVNLLRNLPFSNMYVLLYVLDLLDFVARRRDMDRKRKQHEASPQGEFSVISVPSSFQPFIRRIYPSGTLKCRLP